MPVTEPKRFHEVQSRRHVQNIFIQESVQIALAILNKETTDRTARLFELFKKNEVRVAFVHFKHLIQSNSRWQPELNGSTNQSLDHLTTGKAIMSSGIERGYFPRGRARWLFAHFAFVEGVSRAWLHAWLRRYHSAIRRESMRNGGRSRQDYAG